MILTVTALIFCFVLYGESVNWKDRNMGNTVFSETENEMEKARCLEVQDEFCKNSQDIANSLAGHLLKKKASAYSFSGMPGTTKIFPGFQSLHQCPCSCKMDYPLMDLGRQYFPRFLQTGVCKADSCGSHHRCVEKKYKVLVIKQKDFTDQDVPETKGLPSSLQDSWVSESVSVSIACECVPIM